VAAEAEEGDPMAMEIVVQRLQVGDVIRVDLGDGDVEATVVRDIERTEEDAVRVTLRVAGHGDVGREWHAGDMVTVLRGP
jgi:sRNA-binding protein